jgi:hypothetical protein
LRYPAASLGVVVRAAGGDPDSASAEKAFRVEVSDRNVTALTLLEDVLGWEPISADPPAAASFGLPIAAALGLPGASATYSALKTAPGYTDPMSLIGDLPEAGK